MPGATATSACSNSNFEKTIEHPYTILVSPGRDSNAQLMQANYGNVDQNGFVVHLWDTIADRTLLNGNFSFSVFQAPE